MELLQPDEDASEFLASALSILDGLPLQTEADASPLDIAWDGDALAAPAALLSTSSDDDGGDAAGSAAALELKPVATASASASALLGAPVVARGPARSAKSTLLQQLGADKRRQGRKQLIHSNSNKARDERKLELLYLRQKVQDMEQQLRTLQASRLPAGRKRVRDAGANAAEAEELGSAAANAPRALVARGSAFLNSHDEAALALNPDQPQVWKAMCLRQIQHRAKAERENVRLKRVLEGQIKIAKSMEKLLRKPTEHIGASLSKRSKSLHVPPTDPTVDNLIFQRLLSGIDATYREVDEVFQVNGLTTLETSHRGAQMREGPQGIYLDVFVNSVLPFDMHSTADAVWEHYKGPQKHHGSLYEKTAQTFEPTEDTILENFVLELFANNTLADFRVWQVVRRYMEDERVVIVWVSDVVPVEVAHKQFSGIGFQEKGYVVCKRPRSTAESSPDAFTVVQVCYRITPHATAPGGAPGARPTPSSTKDIGALTEFVLGTTEMNVVAHQELIENVLLEQAFKSRGLR